MTISRLKGIRTNEGGPVGIDASAAVIGVGSREWTEGHRFEGPLDGVFATVSVVTEPGGVVVVATRKPLDVLEGQVGVVLGFINGGLYSRLLGCRVAAGEDNLPLENMGNGEVTRELNLGDTLNIGTEVLGGVVGIYIGKEVRWFDRVISSTGFGEVVRSGD